jgi:hypothetical protein
VIRCAPAALDTTRLRPQETPGSAFKKTLAQPQGSFEKLSQFFRTVLPVSEKVSLLAIVHSFQMSNSLKMIVVIKEKKYKDHP